MEDLTDIFALFDQVQQIEVKYSAVFNPDTGRVTSVGPSAAFTNEKHKLEIDRDLAESIIDGKIRISSCIVDVRNNKFEINEIKTVFKIDDVLHRICTTEWTSLDCADVYVVCNVAEKTVKIEMTEEFHGTYKLPEKYQPAVKRNVLWDGETVINFFITDYNDTNIMYNMLSLKVSDLVNTAKVFTDVDFPPKFSLYTRRIFKNYIMETV
jgi:hypothetical protein